LGLVDFHVCPILLDGMKAVQTLRSSLRFISVVSDSGTVRSIGASNAPVLLG
jgi:hypothetical protein